MLVVHSELDYRLPISEGLAMFNVLQAKGIPSKLVCFPDENHVSWDFPISPASWLLVGLMGRGTDEYLA